MDELIIRPVFIGMPYLNEALRIFESIFYTLALGFFTIVFPLKLLFGDKIKIMPMVTATVKGIFVPLKLIITNILLMTSQFFKGIGSVTKGTFKYIGISIKYLLKYLGLLLSNLFKGIYLPLKAIVLHVFNPIIKFLGKSVFSGFSGFFKMFQFLFKGKPPDNQRGARFLNEQEIQKIMSGKEKGLLIDGNEKRISKDLSFTHLLLVSSTGGGKTSKYIIPNVLTLAGSWEPNSMVITDPSGEIFEKTSGYLRKKGYVIQTLNPAKPDKSFGYNPLAKVTTLTDVGEIAHILVNSANPDARDPFWNQGAETIIEIFIHCLKALNRPEFLNLHNVLYLLQNFGDRQEIDRFVATNATDTVFNQYRGFIGGNPNTVSSFLSTATTSLRMFNNTDICQMMSVDEIDFMAMRKKKTALFLIIPSERMSYYSFFLNIFYTQFFQAMMKVLPDKKSVPVFALMDEFANIGTIPSFTTILTTIRKYKVSLSLVIQDLSQLSSKYGREEMTTILGNTASKLCYGGVDMNTAQYFENMIGRVHSEERNPDTGHITYRDHNLMDAQQIRTMPKEKALCMVSNKNPILLNNVLPYYENPKFKYEVKLQPYDFTRQHNFSPIEYVSL